MLISFILGIIAGSLIQLMWDRRTLNMYKKGGCMKKTLIVSLMVLGICSNAIAMDHHTEAQKRVKDKRDAEIVSYLEDQYQRIEDAKLEIKKAQKKIDEFNPETFKPNRNNNNIIFAY